MSDLEHVECINFCNILPFDDTCLNYSIHSPFYDYHKNRCSIHKPAY